MRCLDKSQNLEIWGNYNTDQTQSLKIIFEKCDLAKRPNGAKCKTETEIAAWMEGKSIVLIHNEARFIQHKFGEDRVEKKSYFSWYNLDSKNQKDFVRIITRSKLQLGDSVFNLAGLMLESVEAFSVEDAPSRLLPSRLSAF